MAANLTDRSGVNLASEADRRTAEESARELASVATAGTNSVTLLIDSGGTKRSIPIPASVLGLLTTTLTHLANGDAVTLLPTHSELTTQQAADLLNVSRPFVIGLMTRGDLPYHLVGTHRRVRINDLIDYRARNDAERLTAR
jgi:excisionase family DNA binding protein